MLKKSIASLVLSMVMLASGSVFAFSDTGVKNHADGKDLSLIHILIVIKYLITIQLNP